MLMMEYLTRLLLQLDRIPDFYYHTKCEKMKITSLSFVDDMLLFSKGGAKSVELMEDQVHTFSCSSGLKMNPNKCFIYFEGVDISTKEEIRRITGFNEGMLPLIYLGIPLTSTKLDAKHY